jgi:hypothetical protein
MEGATLRRFGPIPRYNLDGRARREEVKEEGKRRS